jgi:HEAT repeat protein
MKMLLLVLLLGVGGDVEALLSDLESPDFQTRRKAVLACEGRPEPEIFERLLVMAREDDHPNIRGFVADVLPSFDDPRVFPLLVEMVDSESRWPGPRQSALVALGRTGDPRAYDVLIARLGADPQTAAYAAKGLGLLGDERAFDRLLTLFDAHPEDGWVGPAASEALGRIDPERASAAMLERFGELSEAALFYAANVLAKCGDEKASPKLAAHLLSGDESRRRAAIVALGGIGGEVAVDVLLRHLAKTGEDVAAVARAIRDCGDASCAPKIVRALAKEEDPATKMVLMETLGVLGNRRAVRILAGHLTDETFVAQPPWMSSIGTFPLNTRVNAAAWWAIRSILDGHPPVPLESLSALFGEPPAQEKIEDGIRELLAWWEAHSGETEYRFPPRK